MYFPILRGKQYELSALKELALINSFDYFLPIIEPVKKNTKDLLLSVKKLNEKNIRPIIIMNPNIGEYKNNSDLFYTLLEASKINIDYLPCINMNNPNADFFLKKFNDFTLLFDEYYAIDEHLLSQAKILFLPQHTGESIIDKLENIVLYGDFFPKIKRNADYPSESLLTDLNVQFKNKKNVIGYGDFTITPKKYSNGGGPAFVVAIHSTYTDLNRNYTKYVKHYLSYDDNSTDNVGKKFLDAVNKFLQDVDFEKISFYKTSAINDFRNYRNKKHYPGLGISKKISIKHHIETTNEFLKLSST